MAEAVSWAWTARDAVRAACGLIVGGVVLMTVANVTGCGSGGMSADTVAQVRTHVITRAVLDHWIAVLARREYEAVPAAPVPEGIVPDPPRYSRCIARMKSTASESAAAVSAAATSVEYGSQCAQQYATLRQLALGSLITGEWLIAEGEQRGFTVSDKEAEQRRETVRKNQFRSEAEFQKYMTYTGETLSDQLFRARIKLFSAKIYHQIMAQGHTAAEHLRAFASFAERFARTWADKTSCRSGYVVPNCSEYKGQTPPETKLL
jgi:hypothetical protein